MNLTGHIQFISGSFSVYELTAQDADVPQLDKYTKYLKCTSGGSFKIPYSDSIYVNAIIDYYDGSNWSRKESSLNRLIIDNSWLSYSNGYLTFTLTTDQAVATLDIKEGIYISNESPSGPVQLTIAYTATQFDFKWKASSGSTLIFHWDDGTTSSVAGQDGTLVTTTSAYSSAGTYNFWITGDVTDLTYIDISSQAFVSGDVSTWSALVNMTFVNVSSTGVTGSIDGWIAWTGLTSIRTYTTALTGDLSLFASLSPQIFRCYDAAFTFDSDTAWSGNGQTLYIQDNAMTSTMVNNAIAAFSSCINSLTNVAGTNAHRTAASNDDLNTLLANGNTITLNDVLGAELHTTANAASDPNGNEADATTGWSQSGLDVGANVFESQSAVKSTGSYALHADANDTPTAGARIYIDLEAVPFSLSNGDVVRLEFDARHTGSGSFWNFVIASNTALNSDKSLDKSFGSTETTFVTTIYYWTHDVNHRYFGARENTGSNDGGIYLDNLSIKKVTLS